MRNNTKGAFNVCPKHANITSNKQLFEQMIYSRQTTRAFDYDVSSGELTMTVTTDYTDIHFDYYG